MELANLLEKALHLAHEGHLEVPHLEDLKRRSENAEAQVALFGEFLAAYEQEAERAVGALDGTALTLQQWREAQQLLVATRREVRLLQEALSFIREEVERQVALGLHNRARSQKDEVRA